MSASQGDERKPGARTKSDLELDGLCQPFASFYVYRDGINYIRELQHRMRYGATELGAEDKADGERLAGEGYPDSTSTNNV